MPTDCLNCGSNYGNDLLHCPNCGEPNHRLTGGSRSKNLSAAVNAGLTRRGSKTRLAINTIRDSIPESLEHYTMQKLVPDPKHAGHSILVSAESATTTVKYANGEIVAYKTTLQMHSEMVALQAAYERGEYGFANGSIQAPYTLTTDHFSTSEPHCGFCSIILWSIGMPLCTPTAGNGKQAANFDFPLPKFLKQDAVFYANLISGSDDGSMIPLKLVLNSFFKTKQWALVVGDTTISDDREVYDLVGENQEMPLIRWETILEFEDVMKRLWEEICRAIYETNKEAAV